MTAFPCSLLALLKSVPEQRRSFLIWSKLDPILRRYFSVGCIVANRRATASQKGTCLYQFRVSAPGLTDLNATLRGLVGAQALIAKPRITVSDRPCWRRFDQS